MFSTSGAIAGNDQPEDPRRAARRHAHLAGCVLFVANDAGFRGVTSVSLVILDDLLTP
jgi:hypothetical protein